MIVTCGHRVDLAQLRDTLASSGGFLPLPLIKNKKTVNPRDSKSAPVFQLETAMGSAIECFANAGGGAVVAGLFLEPLWCYLVLVLESKCHCRVSEAVAWAGRWGPSLRHMGFFYRSLLFPVFFLSFLR